MVWKLRFAASLAGIVMAGILLLGSSSAALAVTSVFSVAPGAPFGTSNGAAPNSVAFNPSGSLLAAPYGGDFVSVLSVTAPTGTLSPLSGSPFLTSGADAPFDASFSPSGGLLATANISSDSIAVFTVGAGGALSPVSGSPFSTGVPERSVVFSPAGGFLATASDNSNGPVSVYPVAANGTLGTAHNSVTGTVNTPVQVAFSPNGQLVAAANEGPVASRNLVSVFSVGSSGSLSAVTEPSLPDHSTQESVAFSPSGGLLAAVNDDQTVTLYAVAANGVLSQLSNTPTGSEPFSVAFSPNGKLLAVANGADGTVSVFSVAADGTLMDVAGSPYSTGVGSTPGRVAFSSSGGLLAVADKGDSNIWVFTVGAPSALIASPASGGLYAVGQPVPTGFTCAEAPDGPGILACLDSAGSTSPGLLPTSSPGHFTYTVSATSSDGQVFKSSLAYTVASAPTVQVTSPSAGQSFVVGQRASASFACTDGADGPGISSCLDATGAASPAQLPTSTPGHFTYTVKASSKDGQTATASVSYSVVVRQAAVSILARHLKVKAGQVSVGLRCRIGDPGGACRGTLLLRIGSPATRHSTSGRLSPAASVVIAKGRYDIRAGRTRRIRIALTRRGLTAIAALKRAVRVRAEATLDGGPTVRGTEVLSP